MAKKRSREPIEFYRDGLKKIRLDGAEDPRFHIFTAATNTKRGGEQVSSILCWWMDHDKCPPRHLGSKEITFSSEKGPTRVRYRAPDENFIIPEGYEYL